MRKIRSFAALCLALTLMAGAALAGRATPTPEPVDVPTHVIRDVPETIQALLDLAHSEWEELGGRALRRSNKYTRWRNNYEWGWCGGFITWCMIQLDVPQETWTHIEEGDVDGIVHVHEAGVGKLLTGYLRMHRVTNVPQKGFIVVYGKSGSGGTYHVGLVYDVEELGNGRYRLTTIEGNMSNTVRMYIHDYDMNAERKTANLSAIPQDERTLEESRSFSYKLQDKKWYINCFLMPWDPNEYDWAEPVPEADEAVLVAVPLTPTPAP